MILLPLAGSIPKLIIPSPAFNLKSEFLDLSPRSSNSSISVLLFNLIFLDNQDKKDRILTQIKRVIALEKNLSKIEKMVIKFGIIHGFQSNNYRKEMFRFIKIPLALKSNNNGSKFISSYKFKEIFYFAYNLVKRGRTNDRPPKF